MSMKIKERAALIYRNAIQDNMEELYQKVIIGDYNGDTFDKYEEKIIDDIEESLRRMSR